MLGRRPASAPPPPGPGPGGPVLSLGSHGPSHGDHSTSSSDWRQVQATTRPGGGHESRRLSRPGGGGGDCHAGSEPTVRLGHRDFELEVATVGTSDDDLSRRAATLIGLSRWRHLLVTVTRRPQSLSPSHLRVSGRGTVFELEGCQWLSLSPPASHAGPAALSHSGRRSPSHESP